MESRYGMCAAVIVCVETLQRSLGYSPDDPRISRAHYEYNNSSAVAVDLITASVSEDIYIERRYDKVVVF